MPNYFPATYQPYYFQPIQQPAQQPVQQTSMLWVGSEQEAQSYPVAPNNAVALWDSANPIVYIKQADASGKPSLKAFDLAERTSTPQPPKDADYATKNELAALSAAIDGLKGDVSKLRKRMKREDDDE